MPAKTEEEIREESYKSTVEFLRGAVARMSADVRAVFRAKYPDIAAIPRTQFHEAIGYSYKKGQDLEAAVARRRAERRRTGDMSVVIDGVTVIPGGSR